MENQAEKTKKELLEPKLPTPFPVPRDFWTCPDTGMKVPKKIDANLRFRAELLRRAEDDVDLQQDLMTICSKSILFWINTFCFTYKQFDIDPIKHKQVPAKNKHIPFITWDIQDKLVLRALYKIIAGEDLGCDKSRDMGATWIFLAVLHWIWLFWPDSKILELSRTEDYVDKSGNHKALFWKHDYINLWLPEWMTPPDVGPGQKNRTKMRLHNELNGSTIEGESTTRNAARGDRRTVVLMDEFAAVENGEEMRSATTDVTPCRLINSTPLGPGTAYTRWIKSGQIEVFILDWRDHPEKGLERYTVYDEEKRAWKIRSPWYDNEAKRRSPQEMAQEIDRDHIGSGSIFFDPNMVETHKILFGAEPKGRYNIELVPGVANDELKDIIKKKDLKKVYCKRAPKGPLKIWTNLIDGRPDQSKSYTFGIDISKGQGASNSVVSVRCEQTGEKIAEWASALLPPYEFARVVVALAIWVGGANPRKLPFLIWEANGDPGIDFGKLMVKVFIYPYFYRDESTGKITTKQTQKYGFHSSRIKKEELLGTYRRHLAIGGFINHSIMALDEVVSYVYYDGGGIGPATLVEESSSARMVHGDRVIADALSCWSTKQSFQLKNSGPSAPINSVAGRQKIARDKAKQGRSQGSFRKKYDFRKVAI